MPEIQKYTISETFELPSKGQIYDEKISSKIDLRAMTARDEMKRLNPTSTPLKTIADIIESCMINKPAIHVYDMISGDYEFLLHKLRTITYGSDYKMIVYCPNCGQSHETVAQLDSLAVKPFDLEEFETLRTLTLPDSGKEVYLNYQTPRTIDEAANKAKELKAKMRNANIDFDTYVTLGQAIKTLDGNKLTATDIDYLLDELTAKDLAKIITGYDKVNSYVGIDNTFYLTCNSCGGDIVTSFRLGSEFFRPTTI